MPAWSEQAAWHACFWIVPGKSAFRLRQARTRYGRFPARGERAWRHFAMHAPCLQQAQAVARIAHQNRVVSSVSQAGESSTSHASSTLSYPLRINTAIMIMIAPIMVLPVLPACISLPRAFIIAARDK